MTRLNRNLLAFAELAQLKALLDAAIANSTSPADQAAMQAIADRVTALTATLQTDSQKLADAEAVNAPTN